MDEDDYDRLLDAIELAEAERIKNDPNDPVLAWDEVKDQLITNRVAELRERKGVTQSELARRLGVRQSTISRMESSKANLTIGSLRKIARALQCSVGDLIS